MPVQQLLRRRRRGRHYDRLIAQTFLQFYPEPVLLHFKNGEIVLLHQVDEGFDIFKVHGATLLGDKK